MEASLSHKRYWPGDFGTPTLFSSHDSFGSPVHNPTFSAFPAASPSRTSPHGRSSSFQTPGLAESGTWQKRRRLENLTTSDLRPFSLPLKEQQMGPISTPYQPLEHGPTSSSPSDARYIPADDSFTTSPIARSMANLSFLFYPCCGVGDEPSGAYQNIPETSSYEHHIDKAHSSEKMSVAESREELPRNEDDAQASHHPPRALASSSSAMVCPQQNGVSLLEDFDHEQTNAGLQSALISSPAVTRSVKEQTWRSHNEPTMQQLPFPSRHGSTVPNPYEFASTHPQFSLSHPPPQLVTPNVPGRVLAYQVGDGIYTTSIEGWNPIASPYQPAGFGLLSPNPRSGKRGPFKEVKLREQTARTRKLGSCIRCRMQRIRCEFNPLEIDGSCMTCAKVSKTKMGFFPCLRYKITDVKLFKPGQVPGFEWTRRWSHNVSDSIEMWSSSEVKLIRVSEGYSKQFLELRVRQFVPQDGDKLERTWDHKGQRRSVSIPPYAMVDLEKGREAYERYICDSMVDAMPKFLGPRNGLLYKSYVQAWHLCKDPSTATDSLDLLNCAFRLWMSIRFSTAPGFIVGDETLGMSQDILDTSNPNHGMIPIPPVLGAQLDVILIHHIQSKLRRELLERLQKVYLKNKQNTWLLTYLVTFMLLHNAALITAHDANYARKHGMKRRFAREEKVKEYYLGANILLAHFHYCNKGTHPFSDDCKDEDLRMVADLNDDQIQFIHATRAYAKQHKAEWDEMRAQGEYENGYYFISQLYEESWQPRAMQM